jgi:hypothetical protein
LRISDRKVLDAAYDGENQRHGTEVGIQDGSLSRDLDETVKVDPQAKTSNPKTSSTGVIYIDGMEKNGFFDKLWAGK